MSGTRVRFLERDGWALAYRRTGVGPPLLLLHATLSSSAQLQPLADLLAERFDVIAVDRRGSGESRPPGPSPEGPIDVAVHVDDIAAVLAAERVGPVLVVGHSYGGCLALELAAREPGLVRSVWAYEPPYAPVATAPMRAAFARVGEATTRAARLRGPGAAAEAFLVAVDGAGALERLSPAARQRIRQAGAAALAEAPLVGLRPAGLGAIRCPLVVATGTGSLPPYATLAEALVARIPGAVRASIDGAGHGAPISHPGLIAAAIEAVATGPRP